MATTTPQALLLDLLAVIHRDGGHFTGLNGLERSTAVAIEKVTALIAENEEYERTFELIQQAEQRAVARWRSQDQAVRGLFLPDGANLIVWLLERLERAERELAERRGPVQIAQA